MLELKELGRLFTAPQKQLINRTNSTQQQQPTPVQQPQHSQNPQDTSMDKKQPPTVYLVGQERNLTFLVARDDIFINRTSIEMLRITADNVLTRKLLYVHDEHVKIVGASLNHEGTVLAYTTFEKEMKNPEGIYKSYLVEVEHAKGHRYLFNITGSRFQTIKFIHDTSNKKNTSFLFMRDKEKIEMFYILTEKRKKITRIIAQPELQATFVTWHLWMQWDPESSLLYYLVKKTDQQKVPTSILKKSVTSDENYIDCNLRCCSFSESRRPTMLFDYTIPIRMNQYIPDAGVIPARYDKFPWRNGHCSPDTGMFFQIVRVKNGICFCQQHIRKKHTFTDANETNDSIEDEPFTIDISVYVLHHRVRIDYTIPYEHLQHCETGSRRRLRVFFGQCNNMLVVYLPGVHLQLLDICAEHKPVPSLTFSGADVPHLPFYTSGLEMALGMHAGKLGNTDADRNILINLRKGVVYSYKLGETALETWCMKATDPDLVSFIHILINHIDNDQFLERIMRVLFAPRNRKVLGPAMAEYLTGMSYEIFNKQTTDKDFSRMLPLSTLEKSNLSRYSHFSMKCLSQYDYTNFGGKFVLTIKTPNRVCTSPQLRAVLTAQSNSPSTKKPNAFVNSANSSPVSSPQAAESSPRSFKFSIMNFFARKDDDSKSQLKNEAAIVEDSYCQTSRRLFIEAMAELLVGNIRETKAKQRIMKLITDYTNVVALQTSQLFTEIKMAEFSVEYFRVLECFASALEETCFPVPSGFTSHFAIVAYSVLSRNMFMQYITREVVKVTEELVRYVAKDLFTDSTEKETTYTPKENQHFYSSLLQRLSDQEYEVSNYEKIMTDNSLMIDHYHQSLSINAPGFDQLLDSYNALGTTIQNPETYTETDYLQYYSSFAPLTFFLLSMKIRTSSSSSMLAAISSPGPSSNSDRFHVNSPPTSFFSFGSLIGASREEVIDSNELDQDYDDDDCLTDDTATFEDRYMRFIVQHAEKMLERATPLIEKPAMYKDVNAASQQTI